jgi:hypothetical protein
MEALITLLVTLSVASERLTDIAKNKLTILNKPTDGSTPRLSDKQRTVWIQILSLLCSGITVYIAQPMLADSFKQFTTIGGMAILTLLISGGSSFWNSIQQYMLSIKGGAGAKKAAAEK